MVKYSRTYKALLIFGLVFFWATVFVSTNASSLLLLVIGALGTAMILTTAVILSVAGEWAKVEEKSLDRDSEPR